MPSLVGLSKRDYFEKLKVVHSHWECFMPCREPGGRQGEEAHGERRAWLWLIKIKKQYLIVENHLTRQEYQKKRIKELYVFNPGHLRRNKQTQPLTWIRTFTWEAAISSSSSCCPGSFSHQDCGGITSGSWDYTFRGASTAPSPAPSTLTGRRTLKSGKRQPLLSFVSGEIQDNQLLRGDQSINLLLLSTLLSSYKVPQILLTWGVWAALTCPFKALAEQNLLPLLGLKPGLSTQWTRSHVLNPGLPLESPGALPTRHTDAPTGPRENQKYNLKNQKE